MKFIAELVFLITFSCLSAFAADGDVIPMRSVRVHLDLEGKVNLPHGETFTFDVTRRAWLMESKRKQDAKQTFLFIDGFKKGIEVDPVKETSTSVCGLFRCRNNIPAISWRLKTKTAGKIIAQMIAAAHINDQLHRDEAFLLNHYCMKAQQPGCDIYISKGAMSSYNSTSLDLAFVEGYGLNDHIQVVVWTDTAQGPKVKQPKYHSSLSLSIELDDTTLK